MKSSVVTLRLCLSLRASPMPTPCVNTLFTPAFPYAPSGANVTALDPGSSRQFDGMLTRISSPSMYVVKSDEGGATARRIVECPSVARARTMKRSGAEPR